jgi:hypothetical protein
MGYTSTADPLGQTRLYFDSEKAAVAFAEKLGVSYELELPQVKKKFVKSYEGKFKWRYVMFTSSIAFEFAS